MLKMYEIDIFSLTPLPLKQYVLYDQFNANNYGQPLKENGWLSRAYDANTC